MEASPQVIRTRWQLVIIALTTLAVIAALTLKAPPSPAQTAELFSGRLTTSAQRHSFSTGAGVVEATLSFTRAPGAVVSLVTKAGATVASASGSNGTASLSTSVAHGTYDVVVVGTGSWKGAAKYELSVSHPEAPAAVTNPTTTTTATPTTTTAPPPPTTTTTPPTTTPPAPQGNVHDIPTSIASDCSRDVTAALNSWFASVPDGTAAAPNTLRFGAGRCYRVDGTLVNPRENLAAPSRRHLVFDGNGSTLDGRSYVVPSQTATKINHSMWMFTHAEGVTLANFTMHGQHPNPCNIDTAGNCRDGGAIGAYEWYAGVAFEGGRDLVVRDSRILNMYGDGVNIAQGSNCWQGAGVWGADHPINVRVENNVIDGTGRHGVSISAGENVTVVGNRFDRISYQVSDLEYECSQPVRNITFDRNVIQRHYLGFIASTTGGEYHLCPPEGFNGGYVIVNNVMERSGVTTTPPIWTGSTQTSYCTTYDKAGIRVEGNTLRYNHAEGTNSAIQVDTTAGAVTIRNNRIIQPGTAPAVKLTRLRATSRTVSGNDMRESSWAYSLDGVNHAPAVTACGNIISTGSNQPSWCA